MPGRHPAGALIAIKRQPGGAVTAFDEILCGNAPAAQGKTSANSRSFTPVPPDCRRTISQCAAIAHSSKPEKPFVPNRFARISNLESWLRSDANRSPVLIPCTPCLATRELSLYYLECAH